MKIFSTFFVKMAMTYSQHAHSVNITHF